MKKLVILFLLTLALGLACKEKIPSGPRRGQVMEALLSSKDGRTDYVQWNHFDDRYDIQKIDQASFNQMMAWQVPFAVNLTNTFDEVIDGTKEIKIRVNVWQAGSNWVRHLSYTEVNLSDSVLLQPGRTRNFYTADSLVWDQRDDAGQSIFPVGHYKQYLVKEVRRDSLVPDTVNGKPGYVIKTWADCDTLAALDRDSVVAFKNPATILATASVKLFHEYDPVQTDTLVLHIRYFFPASYLRRKIGCYPGFRNSGGG